MATKKVSTATKSKRTLKSVGKKTPASRQKVTAKPKKAARKVSPPHLNIEGIKDVKDVKKVLKALEKRIKTVERENEGVIDKLVETLRLKQIYAKGNKMVSQAYKYTRNKCVGK